MKGKNVTPEFARNVKLLLDKGLAPKDIIPIMGCSYQTISRIRDGVHPALYANENKQLAEDVVNAARKNVRNAEKLAQIGVDEVVKEVQQIKSALYLIADQIKKLNDTWNS